MPAPDRKPQRTSNSSFDPLAINLQPPPNETEEEKAVRLEAAKEATRVSRTIDAGLAESKKLLERKKRAVKILLLGQSESGKSSVLRNFRLTFTPKYFESERLVWKTVIQLNLISSIKKILTVLQEEWEAVGDAQSPTTPDSASPDAKPSTPLTSDHRRLALSLSPLLAFETSIGQMMDSTTGGYTVTVRPGGGWKHKLASFGRSPSTTPPEAHSPDGRRRGREREQRPVAGDAGARGVQGGDRGAVGGQRRPGRAGSAWGAFAGGLGVVSDAFLDDTPRIAALDYVPSDRDIMRARIRTLGVEEHRFVTESGFRAGTEFYITDVCGSSNQVRWAGLVWAGLGWVLTSISDSGQHGSVVSRGVPYFDDVQAIIFLAPLAFWSSLDEDNTKVNRVQDSLELWREIVGNPLLAKTAFILLFNKKDILQAHIAAGKMVKKYVPSFGDRTNDVASVTKYFRDKFSAYHKKFSPEPRPFIVYETEAIDTKSTAVILGEVQEQIIRNHLKDLDVM
ncbi:G-protein alpha subunit [Mycena venus]|uniref:G-protein alpha subunit n=1 Tax=Mycena venus TaxID=2733690 RepID=A0A8H6YCG3_9AGAR|nr:G-protein alpha subunit [Mycena venus]